MVDPTEIAKVLSLSMELVQEILKRRNETKAVDVFVDRSNLFTQLFDTDQETRQKAYVQIYADCQATVARKGMSPSSYWYDDDKKEGAPVIKFPVALLQQLMDAASR